MIVQQYDTLALSDVYAVISYYLRHREEIQSYLDDREQRGTDVRRRIEESQRATLGTSGADCSRHVLPDE